MHERLAAPIDERLLAFALSLPEAYEDHPWDEVVAKVNKKIFVFFGLAAKNSTTGCSSG